MNSKAARLLICAIILVGTSCCLPTSFAQQPAEPKSTDELALRQGKVADQYQRLEMMMLKMAEFDAAENPGRAALLRKALSQSKDRHVRSQMDALVELLQKQQLRRAIDDQTDVRDDLKLLLELLLSENRNDRIKKEQTRVREYIRELQRIIRQHRSVQGRTEGGESTERLAQDQNKVAERTDQLRQSIDTNERESGKAIPGEDQEKPDSSEPKTPSEQPAPDEKDSGQSPEKANPDKDPAKKGDKPPKSDSESPSDKQSGSKSDADEKPSDGSKSDAKSKSPSKDSDPSSKSPAEQPSADDKKDGESQPGQPGDSNPSKSNGSPNQQQPSDSNQPGDKSGESQNEPTPPDEQDSFPGRKRIKAAHDRMKKAQQGLEKAERKQAIAEQEEARKLLEQAKAELEEILRQLREEEVERSLATLESRFRKMLEMQTKVFDDTKGLNTIPATNRNKEFDVQAGKLALEERKIVEEADRAMLLLTEEGSSVAFPEATQEIRDDMRQVAERLGKSQLGQITQVLEEDIISALQEMIEAFQLEQKKAEERRKQQQPQQPQSGEDQDQPLVDALAELKMIKSLQMRINKRTQTYAKLLANSSDPVGQATEEGLIDSLRQLAEREERVQKITRDIVLRKNQ